MSLNPYDPCACGSGKKLKFCCLNIADEMDRIVRLSTGNQPHIALQQLEILARKFPANPWVGTTRAIILLEQGEASTARDVLRALVEHQPDHEFVIVLLAAALFQADGFDPAKKAIHRAFQKSAKKYSSMVSGIAASMAMILMNRQQVMAAREHLGLALRLAPEKQRQELFVQLLEFDGEEGIPYPMRGTHLLPSIQGPEELQKEIKKAQKYAAIGCWSTAADLFLLLTRTLPESAEAWHSAGLCRAWDGDEATAAEALHRAAQLYGDFAAAVECETLAQLFDRHTTKDVIDICTYEGQVESIGRLLTVLDEQPRLVRVTLPPANPDQQHAPVAGYQVLDRPQWTGDDFTQLTLDSLPRLQSHLSVYDANPNDNEPPTLFISGDRGSALEEARSLIESVSTGLMQWRTDKPQPEVTGGVPTESMTLRWSWSLPKGTPMRVSRKLRDQQWQTILNETWPAAPLKVLGGRSPSDAATDPKHKVALTAAVFMLDAHCQQQGHELNLDAMLAKFGLTSLAPLDVDERTLLSGQSVMQMHRLPIERLTDAQLNAVVNRALLTRHDRFLYAVLKTALARPACEAELDLPRVHRALVELCSRHGRREEALQWIDVARTKVPEEGKSFEHHWNWDINELTVRLEEPSDPGLQPLLDRFVNYYSPKVPQMRGYVERMLESVGVPSPWESINIVTAGNIPAQTGGVWTSGTPAAATAGNKLWLPGQ